VRDFDRFIIAGRISNPAPTAPENSLTRQHPPFILDHHLIITKRSHQSSPVMLSVDRDYAVYQHCALPQESMW
jgi:hypothetical protein